MFQVKKLVYVYLTRYAEEQQDLALLSISTFQRALKVMYLPLTLFLLLSYTYHRRRSGPTKHQYWSGFKLFDTLIGIPERFFEKITMKKSADNKKHAQLPIIMQRVEGKCGTTLIFSYY